MSSTIKRYKLVSNAFIIISLLLSSQIVYAQKWHNVQPATEYETKSGAILKVGDVLHINSKYSRKIYTTGHPVYAVKSAIKSGQIKSRPSETVEFVAYLVPYTSAAEMTQERTTIKNFWIATRKNGDKKVFAVTTSFLFKMIIDIDEALQREEVAIQVPEGGGDAFSAAPKYPDSNRLDSKTAHLLYIKEQDNAPIGDFTEHYMNIYQSEFYKENRSLYNNGNEFEKRKAERDLQQQKAETETLLREEVSAPEVSQFNYDETYTVFMERPKRLREYDFEEGYFPISMYSNFVMIESNLNNLGSEGVLIHFTNSEEFTKWKKPENDAAKILTKVGDDRNVYLKIEYKLDKNNLINNSVGYGLNAKIINVYLYSDSRFKPLNLIGQM